MKTIHYFGDSHTAGIGNDGSPKKDIYYHIPYRKYLSELLNVEEKNYSFGGKHFILNMVDLIENIGRYNEGDYIIFQTQFFCNSLLKYDEYDFIVSSGKFSNTEIYENPELGITHNDSVTLLKWTLKFEERRSMYDLKVVIDILKWLRTKNINTYLLYWMNGFDVNLPDSEILLKFNNNPYVLNMENISTINEATNGEWDDAHTTNEFNKHLAYEIYNIITKK